MARYNTPDWNPLGELVPTGSNVFVLCNFVHHKRVGETKEQFRAKCTHGSVVRAVVDYLLIAVGENGKVRIGNAPVQSCNWGQVLRDTGTDKVIAFYEQRGLPVEACDLRLLVAERDLLGRLIHLEERTGDNLAVEIDLGADSLLEEIGDKTGFAFRVNEYDPKRIEAHHTKGKHVYILHRHILDSDVVFSIPKLKTHRKVGVTCALKGCVGTIAHKDCLAHHSFGASGKGGDEYPNDPAGVLRLLSRFHDYAWHKSPHSSSGKILRIIDRNLRRIRSWTGLIADGAWWGNDTAWRMALDIARIVAHAQSDGQLSEQFVRPHYALVDGIVGGEGNGPLRPEPVNSGMLLFGSDISSTDKFCASWMGFDPSRIPLVKAADRLDKYRVRSDSTDEPRLLLNGKPVTAHHLKGHSGRSYKPPPGWLGHIEHDSDSGADSHSSKN